MPPDGNAAPMPPGSRSQSLLRKQDQGSRTETAPRQSGRYGNNTASFRKTCDLAAPDRRIPVPRHPPDPEANTIAALRSCAAPSSNTENDQDPHRASMAASTVCGKVFQPGTAR